MNRILGFLFSLFRVFSLINLNSKDFIVYDYTFGFNGHSKALYEYYVETFPESKVFFVTAKPNLDNKVEVSRFSMKGLFFMLFFRNFAITVGMPSYVNLKNKKVTQFWHGTPMKSLGRFDKSVSDLVICARCNEFNMYNYIIVQNRLLADSLINSYMITDTNKVLSLSNPYLEKIQQQRSFYLKDKRDNQFNLVYLPTYRKNSKRYWDLFRNDSFLSFLKINNINFNVRYHPSDSEFSSSETEMEIMLSEADLLITDYSSVAFDAVDIGINTFLSWLDFDDYVQERGLEANFHNYYNFSIFYNIESLKSAIEAILEQKTCKHVKSTLDSEGMKIAVINAYS